MHELIIDTGFFIALAIKNDQFHKKAIRLKSKIDKKKWITTWPVLTEVSHLLATRNHERTFIDLLRVYELGGFDVYPLSQNHVTKIVFLMEKYKELPMDLADASLVILAEELGHGTIVSTDTRDFGAYRWKNHKPFHNLFV